MQKARSGSPIERLRRLFVGASSRGERLSVGGYGGSVQLLLFPVVCTEPPSHKGYLWGAPASGTF
jgi:hypothetical protein